MGKPLNLQSLDGANATGTGEELMVLGHYHLGVFVALSGYDSASDSVEVAVEVSPNGDDWANAATVDTFGDAGNAYQALTGNPAEHVRLNVQTFTDDAGGDLAVDGWVMGTGWEAAGVRGGREF